MACSAIVRGGSLCGKTTLGDSRYCYLKSHHECLEDWQGAVERTKQEFLERTIDPKKFEFIDIDGDGACLYSALSLYLGEEDPYRLQLELKEWLYENRSEPALYGQTVEELVLSSHEYVDSMQEYRSLYHIPASLPKGKNRWGSLAEQYAFSKIYSQTVSTYNLVALDRRNYRTVEASLRFKEPRLNLIQCLGDPEYPSGPSLLLTCRGDAPHYTLLRELIYNP